jgi:hypothetical protein
MVQTWADANRTFKASLFVNAHVRPTKRPSGGGVLVPINFYRESLSTFV